MLQTLKLLYAKRNSKAYINYLRRKGIAIGNGCIFRRPLSVTIDTQRPTLISIGDNVDMNHNFSIYTHDYASGVFRHVYGDVVNSSGAVKIGNNVYFGTDCKILKGVTIGDNCIIGAGSIINRSIPNNSVAVGNPCKVICSLEEYFKKRKSKGLSEAIEYINNVYASTGRRPLLSEMREEYIYFVDKSNINEYLPQMPIIRQLANNYNKWLENHKAPFKNFDEFIDYCLIHGK